MSCHPQRRPIYDPADLMPAIATLVEWFVEFVSVFYRSPTRAEDAFLGCWAWLFWNEDSLLLGAQAARSQMRNVAAHALSCVRIRPEQMETEGKHTAELSGVLCWLRKDVDGSPDRRDDNTWWTRSVLKGSDRNTYLWYIFILQRSYYLLCV